MHKQRRTQFVATGLVACFALLTSCASQKELQTCQDEVLTLRQERTDLKKEIRSLELQLDNAEIRLQEANAALTSRPDAPVYPELDALGIDYGQRGGNMVISVPTEITFGSGKAELSSKGKDALKTVAQTLKREFGDGVYWIEGHTDSDPITKSKFESNRHLSMSRAMAVLHFLVEQCGMPDGQCVVAGHGEYAPVAPNDSKSNKSRNRRVEIVVHAPTP
jgi:chemotaxis protein MotB